jgi:hypothetical protein
MNDNLTGDGVLGESVVVGLEVILLGVLGVKKLGVLLAELCKDMISDKELRRFLRGLSMAWPSPMVVRGLEFSNANAPRTVGRSLETGRFGDNPAMFRTSVVLSR